MIIFIIILVHQLDHLDIYMIYLSINKSSELKLIYIEIFFYGNC